MPFSFFPLQFKQFFKNIFLAIFAQFFWRNLFLCNFLHKGYNECIIKDLDNTTECIIKDFNATTECIIKDYNDTTECIIMDCNDTTEYKS